MPTVGAPALPLGPTHGIVPALDAATVDDNRRTVAATTRIEGVVAYKLGLATVLRLGLGAAVRQLADETDKPIIYDHQKAGPDVPDMAKTFVAIAREAGVAGLILFPVAGPSAVDAFVGGAIEAGLVPLVGGELPLPDYTVKGGGYIADDALARIFERSLGLGAGDFVVPGNEAAKIKRLAERLRATLDRPRLFIPGIGALGGTIKSVMTAAEGCSAYAVVGRAIYAAPDPKEAAKRLAGEALAFV